MAIAVFDSGVGGLTVLRDARRALPRHDFLYYADTRHAPYGPQTAAQVRRHVCAAVAGIARHDIQALVLACNTATAVAVADLRRRYRFPIVGMEPAVKPAVAGNRGKRILVLTTALTLRAGKLAALIAAVDRRQRTVAMAMDELVGFAEAGDFDSARVREYLRRKLRCLRTAEFETIVLGCTHFIFYRRLIRALAGRGVTVMDGNRGTVARLQSVLAGRAVPAAGRRGRLSFYSSGVRADRRRVRQWLALMAGLERGGWRGGRRRSAPVEIT